MLLSELLKGIDCKTALDGCTDVKGLTVDSRKATAGTLFCCIKGLNRDGHDFAAAAAEAGAVVLVERDMQLESQIIVSNTRLAFAAICENYYGNPLKKLKLIGITGTNGKTSITYMLKHILEKSGHKTGLIGTIQNMIGDRALETHYTTPDTFELHELFAQMVEAGCEFCVMEVSSFGLEQGRVAGLHFDTACFTNLSQDHLDTHGTMENYFAAKCLLFERCDRAVVNIDDEWGRKLPLAEGLPLISISEHDGAVLSAQDINCFADGVSFTMNVPSEDKKLPVRAGIPGRFTVYNLLCAAGCAYSVGVSPEDIARALLTVRGVKGRAEVYPTGRDFTIILDYAHSPDGIENILSSMREVCKGRLGILFGCGGDRDAAKRPLMGEAASRLADYVIVTSDNPRSENPESIIEQILPGVHEHGTPCTVIVNRREAMKYAVEQAQKDDVIVFAGKGHETYQILGTGTIHFDEREVLAEIFREMNKIG